MHRSRSGNLSRRTLSVGQWGARMTIAVWGRGRQALGALAGASITWELSDLLPRLCAQALGRLLAAWGGRQAAAGAHSPSWPPQVSAHQQSPMSPSSRLQQQVHSALPLCTDHSQTECSGFGQSPLATFYQWGPVLPGGNAT